MALELGALREALIEAGATPEKAGKAAEEVASYENGLAKSRGESILCLGWSGSTSS
jgi:hypothetical protein